MFQLDLMFIFLLHYLFWSTCTNPHICWLNLKLLFEYFQMANNFQNLLQVKIRIGNGFHECVLPEALVDDINTKGINSSVIQSMRHSNPKYVVVGSYSQPVEIVEAQECSLELANTPGQAMEVEVGKFNIFHRLCTCTYKKSSIDVSNMTFNKFTSDS